MSYPRDPYPPYPPHAGPLSYAGADLTRRPGILTAIAVCSIVFGSLGLLFNAANVVGTAVELLAWDPFTSPSLPGTSADTTPAGDLTPEDAALITAALAQVQPLSEDEQRRLIEALQRAESPLAPPLAGVPWTAAHVTPQVVGSATHEPGDAYDELTFDLPEEDTSGVYDEREVHFDLGGNGDIWIYSDRIELFALPIDLSSVESTVWADGRIDVTGDRPEVYWQVQLWVSAVLFILATALAGVLLAAGILTLRDRPTALWLHQRWAWARIVLSVGIFAVSTWAALLMAEEVEYELGRLYWPAMAAMLMLQLIFGTAYAVAVLIALRTQRVREWYAIPTAGVR